ncbi:glycosyltransferase 87 family protein [Vicingaceae bacterium]|nr:glycosyltransferase 87 family protein [Vicingaceae bacterium]
MRIKNAKTISAIYFASLFFIFIVIEFNRTGDFFVYHQTASDLFDTENIFTKLYGNPPSLFYFGSPSLTTLLYPFSLLPIGAASLLWKLINLFALFRTFQLIDHCLFQPFLKTKQRVTALIIIFIGSFFWVYSNFHLLQLTIVILFLCLEALNQIFFHNRKWLGGFLLGLALCFKITPIVFLPYLL